MPRGKSAAMKSNDLEECCSLSRDVSTSLAVYPSKRAKSENAMRRRLIALIVSAKEFASTAGVDSLAFISHSPNIIFYAATMFLLKTPNLSVLKGISDSQMAR